MIYRPFLLFVPPENARKCQKMPEVGNFWNLKLPKDGSLWIQKLLIIGDLWLLFFYDSSVLSQICRSCILHIILNVSIGNLNSVLILLILFYTYPECI